MVKTKGIIDEIEYEIIKVETRDPDYDCKNQCHKCQRCEIGRNYMEIVGGF